MPCRSLPRRSLCLIGLLALACEAPADPEARDAIPDVIRGPGCASGFDLDDDGICDRDQIDWSSTARIEPGTHRGDIFGLGDDLPAVVEQGLLHLNIWPVPITGGLLPWRLTTAALDPEASDPILLRLRAGALPLFGFDTVEGFFDWLGLPPYPAGRPPPPGAPSDFADWPMGAGLIETAAGPALTFGCTACHAGRLLGRTIVGLPNRHGRANAFFEIAGRLLPLLSTPFVLDLLGADPAERALIERSVAAAASVATRRPAALGLDASVAHMSLSLARRGADPWAEPDAARQVRPEDSPLSHLVADSKPRPFWTAKYKTRWTADGSNQAGNLIVINLLWNEIGRGTDLRAFDAWLAANGAVVDAMTAAVFANEAPRWTDFFPAETIDVAAARRGQRGFARRCAGCHGTYEKAWDAMVGDALTASERLRTTRVVYHGRTPIFDVGTDPQRAQAIAFFAAQVGRLAIVEQQGIVTAPTGGYVPPPLEGIWARYPYLHNNSVPTLCALLTLPEDRPTAFRQGPSEDPATDFDAECVGYPIGDAIPDGWHAIEDSLVDTTLPGLSNRGHRSMIDGSDGNPPLDDAGRRDLVMFLKTL